MHGRELLRCHNQVLLRLLHITTWFTLFFVPVIPYKRTCGLICNICKWMCDVPKDATAFTDEMTAITSQWRAGQHRRRRHGQRVDAYWSFRSPATAATPAVFNPTLAVPPAPSTPPRASDVEDQQPPGSNS